MKKSEIMEQREKATAALQRAFDSVVKLGFMIDRVKPDNYKNYDLSWTEDGVRRELYRLRAVDLSELYNHLETKKSI